MVIGSWRVVMCEWVMVMVMGSCMVMCEGVMCEWEVVMGSW